VLSLFEAFDLPQIRAENDPLNLFFLLISLRYGLDLLSEYGALEGQTVSHLFPEGFACLIDVLIALEDIHGSDGASYPGVCGCPARWSIALSGIIEDQDLIAWDILDLLDLDVLLELDDGFGIIQINLLHLFELFLSLIFRFDVTQIVENVT
jgi:hypothetical protein